MTFSLNTLKYCFQDLAPKLFQKLQKGNLGIGNIRNEKEVFLSLLYMPKIQAKANESTRTGTTGIVGPLEQGRHRFVYAG